MNQKRIVSLIEHPPKDDLGPAHPRLAATIMHGIRASPPPVTARPRSWWLAVMIVGIVLALFPVSGGAAIPLDRETFLLGLETLLGSALLGTIILVGHRIRRVSWTN